MAKKNEKKVVEPKEKNPEMEEWLRRISDEEFESYLVDKKAA